jgi:tetratricopeptide (TPR) repeat protein
MLRIPKPGVFIMGRNSGCLVLMFWLVLLMGVVGVVMAGVGVLRYGGVDGLVLRVRTEVIARQDHPDFVLKPSANPNIDVAAFADQLDAPPGSTPVPDGANVRLVSSEVIPVHEGSEPTVLLSGFQHMWQTWNNCGPATLAMNLSFYTTAPDQAQVASVLKPNRDDKNVNPQEMVAYAMNQGFRAKALVNGDTERLKLLLSNGIPVLLETWLEEEPNDGLGHYRMMIGYDETSQNWIAADSYVGTNQLNPEGAYRGIRVPYAGMDEMWGIFNRTYVVVYPEDKAQLVQSIIGDDMNEQVMWQRTFERFQNEITARPNDPYVWFNLGTALAALGQYDQAATAYDQARHLGLPWRMLWYQFGPFQAYYESGRFQEVIDLANATANSGGEIEEIYYWKGRAQVALGDQAAAKSSWERALVLKPTYADAMAALASLNGPAGP